MKFKSLYLDAVMPSVSRNERLIITTMINMDNSQYFRPPYKHYKKARTGIVKRLTMVKRPTEKAITNYLYI